MRLLIPDARHDAHVKISVMDLVHPDRTSVAIRVTTTDGEESVWRMTGHRGRLRAILDDTIATMDAGTGEMEFDFPAIEGATDGNQ